MCHYVLQSVTSVWLLWESLQSSSRLSLWLHHLPSFSSLMSYTRSCSWSLALCSFCEHRPTERTHSCSQTHIMNAAKVCILLQISDVRSWLWNKRKADFLPRFYSQQLVYFKHSLTSLRAQSHQIQIRRGNKVTYVQSEPLLLQLHSVYMLTAGDITFLLFWWKRMEIITLSVYIFHTL